MNTPSFRRRLVLTLPVVCVQPCGSILKTHLTFPIKLRIGIISAFATMTVAAVGGASRCYANANLWLFSPAQLAALALCLALALEERWAKPRVEVRVDDFNRVTYQPKPSLT